MQALPAGTLTSATTSRSTRRSSKWCVPIPSQLFACQPILNKIQFLNKSAVYGDGKYNLTAATEVRWARLQDSITRNPFFDFTTPRYFTAYAESVFPYRFFVDGRDTSGALNLTVARGFFQDNQFPADWYRRNGSFGLTEIGPDIQALSGAHEILPGHNDGAGNYVLDPEDPGFGAGVSLDFVPHRYARQATAH